MSRLLAASILLASTVSAQDFPFRITEVVPDPAAGADQVIEVTNISDAAANLQGFQFCAQFVYAPMPDLVLAPGASVRAHVNAAGADTAEDVFISFLPLDAAQEGLGLYRPGSGFSFFNDPANIVDFVQWGAGNQPRSGTAVAAGVWSSQGAFTPAPASGVSLAWDGDGNAPDDWFRDVSPTLGAPNTTPTADVVSLGPGCSGQTPPVLSTPSAPALGNQDFRLELTTDQASAPALLFIGLGSTNVPVLGGQCTLYVTTAPVSLQLDLATGPSGDLTLPLPIPDEPSLEGVQLSFQALVANTSPNLKFDVTSGLGVTF